MLSSVFQCWLQLLCRSLIQIPKSVRGFFKTPSSNNWSTPCGSPTTVMKASNIKNSLSLFPVPALALVLTTVSVSHSIDISQNLIMLAVGMCHRWLDHRYMRWSAFHSGNLQGHLPQALQGSYRLWKSYSRKEATATDEVSYLPQQLVSPLDSYTSLHLGFTNYHSQFPLWCSVYCSWVCRLSWLCLHSSYPRSCRVLHHWVFWFEWWR